MRGCVDDLVVGAGRARLHSGDCETHEGVLVGPTHFFGVPTGCSPTSASAHLLLAEALCMLQTKYWDLYIFSVTLVAS